ncbi:MAG: nucleotide exchange factor GrpE [Bacteriovoracaceae bacterium]|nr:nucleotide exchange factor GrpE [Bacteriovoracaceae bacterium]
MSEMRPENEALNPENATASGKENGKENLSEDLSESSLSEKLEAEKNQWKEKYYYLAAEMENMKKRWERDREQIIKFGNDSVIADTLPTLDLFELTVNSIANNQDPQIKNIVIGLNMIQKMFLDSLAKHGLTKIDVLGKPFDPNFHEAISQETVDKKEDGIILQVQQSGYLHNGRLLRAAKVVVNKLNH